MTIRRIPALLLVASVAACTVHSRFATRFPGARVYLDGRFTCTTPCIVTSQSGLPRRYRLEVQQPGHRAARVWLDSEMSLAIALGTFGLGLPVAYRLSDEYLFDLEPLPDAGAPLASGRDEMSEIEACDELALPSARTAAEVDACDDLEPFALQRNTMRVFGGIGVRQSTHDEMHSAMWGGALLPDLPVRAPAVALPPQDWPIEKVVAGDIALAVARPAGWKISRIDKPAFHQLHIAAPTLYVTLLLIPANGVPALDAYVTQAASELAQRQRAYALDGSLTHRALGALAGRSQRLRGKLADGRELRAEVTVAFAQGQVVMAIVQSFGAPAAIQQDAARILDTIQ